jgi:hypothetical protein
VVPEITGESLRPAWKLPNACFIESLVALRQQTARGEVVRAALLSYYYGPNGDIGHTVLTYETSDGFYVIDSANAARPAAIDRRLAADAMALATVVHPGVRAARARLLPVDLTADRPAPVSASVAGLDAGLTNLCAPRERKVIARIPKLGTGKTNHRKLHNIESVWSQGWRAGTLACHSSGEAGKSARAPAESEKADRRCMLPRDPKSVCS